MWSKYDKHKNPENYNFDWKARLEEEQKYLHNLITLLDCY